MSTTTIDTPNAIIASLVKLATSMEVCSYARNLELCNRLVKAEELNGNVLLENAILITMYQNLETRKCVCNLLDIILGYILNANEEFAQKKTLSNTKLETTFDDAPPSIAQLFDDITMPDKKGKTLLYYVIKEGDITTANVILRCQGFNATI